MNWQDLQYRLRGRGRRRLRTYLVALVLATLVPTLLAGAFALWRTADSYREASGNRLADTARTLAHAIERNLGSKTALVEALAAPSGGAAGTAGLQEWLDGAGLLPGALVVSEPASALTGRDRAGLLTAAGLPADTASAVTASGRPAVSNLLVDPPRLAIVTRQVRRGEPVLVGVLVPPHQLVDLAPQDGAAQASMLVAVTDGNGRLLARSRDAASMVGRMVPDWVKVSSHSESHGLFEARTAEGLPIKFAFQRLAGTPGWVVVAGEPLDTFNAGWQDLRRQLLLGGAVAVSLALLMAVWLARQVLHPVALLARDAEHAAEGRRSVASPVETSTIAIQEFEALRERIEGSQAALHQRAEDARRNAEALAVSERRYRTLAQAGALVLWRGTTDGLLFAAAGWEAVTGQPEARALGFGWIEQVHDAERPFVNAMLGEIAVGRREMDVEFRLKVRDGSWRWVRVRGVLVDEPGRPRSEWVGVLEDIDERRRAQAHVAHLAHHDPLTALPNRTRFRAGLAEALTRVTDGDGVAVLYVDLDRFKEVNDTLGHPTGDALLLAVTQRLAHVVRDGDLVARLGGDEFAVVQSGLAGPRDAEHLADRVVSALGAPYELNGHKVGIGASVGIMVAASRDADPDRLLACADMALYGAKQAGRGRYRFFEPDMEARLQARRELERELGQALVRHEFEISYEPVVNVRFGMVCGYEAKVHWRHPRRGPVALQEVSCLADEIGVLRPLGDWILRQACQDAARWPNDLRLSVDITAGQLEDPAFPGVVAEALQRSGLGASRLELEVGEHVLSDGGERMLAALHRLKDLGVRIAIDHFGSSRSALGLLGRFPFDKVKIEESFVRQVGLDKEGDAMVRALTTLCDTLGIASAASGVDVQRQLDLLSSEECVEVQGRLFGSIRRAADLAGGLVDGGLATAPRRPGHTT